MRKKEAHILVVDDDEDILFSARVWLTTISRSWERLTVRGVVAPERRPYHATPALSAGLRAAASGTVG